MHAPSSPSTLPFIPLEKFVGEFDTPQVDCECDQDSAESEEIPHWRRLERASERLYEKGLEKIC